MSFTDEYSHESLSKTLYFAQSFPTEEASQLYEYELEGCNCSPNCQLENQCVCMQRSGTQYEFENVNVLESYRIRENSLGGPSYECNDNCTCSGKICGNRLIQFGPRKNLEVKSCDNDKGLGLFTSKKISGGNFICEYAGEIITEGDAKERYLKYQENREDNYIFCIKEKFGDKLLKTFIDPTKYGNIGRYINHSCEANSKLVVFRMNATIPILGVFAKTDLSKNCEITYDYGCDSQNSYQKITNRKKCCCMSNTCRNYLPCDMTLFL